MTEPLTIRTAEEGDLPALLALYAQLTPAVPPLDVEKAVPILRAFSGYPGSAVFLGWLGERAVATGSLVVVPNLTWGGAPYALIENVVTDAAYRARGFGGQVLRHAVAAAWEQGCYKVMLLSGATDPAVLRFYEGVGFERSKVGFQIRRVPRRDA